MKLNFSVLMFMTVIVSNSFASQKNPTFNDSFGYRNSQAYLQAKIDRERATQPYTIQTPSTNTQAFNALPRSTGNILRKK